MRLILLAAALAIPLAACGGIGSGVASPGTVAAGAVLDATTSTKPADVADKTVLDEAAGFGATKAYTAATRLGTVMAREGMIDKAAFKRLDQKGFDAVQALRRAYLAGNARSYTVAVAEAYAAAADIAALAK